MIKKRKKTMIIMLVIFALAGHFIIQDICYVQMLDAIGAHDNDRVKKLLRLPYLTLDKPSGHIPYRWFGEFDDNNSPLEKACKCGNYEAARMLIERGADASIVQDYHFSLLYLTMQYTDDDDLKLVKLLVENGADPNGVLGEEHDRTVSIEKCAQMECGDYSYNWNTYRYNGIEYDEKADNTQNYNKDRAEMILDIYKYLEEKGGEKPLSSLSLIPLHSATARQNIALMEYLIEQGEFGVNDKDENGETCLFNLFYTTNTKEYNREWKKRAFELLIENDADPNIKNNEGKTAYDRALEEGDKYYAELLKAYMDE